MKTKIQVVRDEIRDRDNNTCQKCGKKWCTKSRKLDVHHLDTNYENTVDVEYDSNNKDKLITLCHKCHFNIEKNKKIKKRGKLSKYASEARKSAIVYLRENWTHLALSDIGDFFGISKQSIDQIIKDNK